MQQTLLTQGIPYQTASIPVQIPAQTVTPIQRPNIGYQTASIPVQTQTLTYNANSAPLLTQGMAPTLNPIVPMQTTRVVPMATRPIQYGTASIVPMPTARLQYGTTSVVPMQADLFNMELQV